MRINSLKREACNKKKAQAALDYLVSWGWVLIIIVVVVIVLFSLGVFRVSPAPTIISGFSGITMQAAQANSTMMVVKLTNNYNQFINITGITVNINGNIYTSLDCLNSIISTGQSTLCRIPVSISTSSYLSNVQISFTPYKSSIYEVSNGTVSSTMVSGAIPINNQLTYFIEKGLPYGSTFDVNYNTSANSTVVSSTSQKVSFNLPFGNYYFSVPTVTYQGCVSSPSPSSGYHTTGADETIQFTSNCTTTFTESSLPPGQQWQVTYNGTTYKNNTGSPITIKTNNVKNAQIYYTASAKSDNLVCSSSASVRLGESYSFSSWVCVTTFTETGLPSGTSWKVTYDGSTTSSTSNSISFSNSPGSYAFSTPAVILTSNGCTTTYTPSPSSGSVNAGSSNSISFSSSTTCVTTFTETGLPSGYTWNVDYDGLTKSDTSPNSISYTGGPGDFSYSISTLSNSSSSLACTTTYTPSPSSGSVNAGSSNSISFSNSTTCITTFTETGLPSGTLWKVDYDVISGGITNSSTSNSITFTTNYGVYYWTANVVSTKSNGCTTTYTPSPSSNDANTGSSNSISFSSSTTCVTTFTETGLPPGYTWKISYDGKSATNASSDPISITTSSSGNTPPTYTATSSVTGYSLDCEGSSQNAIAGTSAKFSSWTCFTDFIITSQSPFPSSKYNEGVSFDGTLSIQNWGNNRTTLLNGQQALVFQFTDPSASSQLVWYVNSSITGEGGDCGDYTGHYYWTPNESSGYIYPGETVSVNYSVSCDPDV